MNLGFGMSSGIVVGEGDRELDISGAGCNWVVLVIVDCCGCFYFKFIVCMISLKSSGLRIRY